MKLKESAKYWEDENGNRWNKSVYNEEEAKAASDSLINCQDCENCQDCKDCKNCYCCEGCFDCACVVAERHAV